MDHAQIQERFSEYWEKSLEPAAREEVEAHLAGCAACQGDYAVFERAMSPLGHLNKVAAPNLKDTVPALIHRRSRGRFFGARGGRRPVEWLSLMMLVIAAAVYVALKLAQPLVRTP